MSDSAAAAATVGYAVLRLGVHQALMGLKCKERAEIKTISTSSRWKPKRNKVTRLSSGASGMIADWLDVDRSGRRLRRLRRLRRPLRRPLRRLRHAKKFLRLHYLNLHSIPFAPVALASLLPFSAPNFGLA